MPVAQEVFVAGGLISGVQNVVLYQSSQPVESIDGHSFLAPPSFEIEITTHDLDHGVGVGLQGSIRWIVDGTTFSAKQGIVTSVNTHGDSSGSKSTITYVPNGNIESSIPVPASQAPTVYVPPVSLPVTFESIPEPEPDPEWDRWDQI